MDNKFQKKQIQVSQEIVDWLVSQKLNHLESYDSILRRLANLPLSPGQLMRLPLEYQQSAIPRPTEPGRMEVEAQDLDVI